MDPSIASIRSLRRQRQRQRSYPDNSPDSGPGYNDEYSNSNQSTSFLSSSPGSVESNPAGTEMTSSHHVPAASGPARKRIAKACDPCRRKKAKVSHHLIAP